MTAIKKFRIAKGMTQEELAAIMGTSQAAVGMWETGARMPRADKLPKLAEVLGCSVPRRISHAKDCKAGRRSAVHPAQLRSGLGPVNSALVVRNVDAVNFHLFHLPICRRPA